ncbi:molybdopterin-dependent oxidoreductase [Candidatus Poribacteria bacterium]|nr:molybdopterin-dependent oxidoreductase [Candidatus Poribacteria bacterium]
MSGDVKKVPVGCGHNCGGACLLIAHVEDGVIKRITTDESLPDSIEGPQLRACLKGRSYRQRIYHPDRLKFPVKRIGERGAGQFERVGWDEALDAIAQKMLDIKEKHGPTAIMNISHSATNCHAYYNAACLNRLLNMFGGQTTLESYVSNDGAVFAAFHTYGTVFTANEREDLLNSKMIIMWGWNPADSIWSTNSSYHVALARERGTRVVAVDPRLTNSAAVLASRWIPIRPATDAAMLIAMAYVLISENLYDHAFLDKYSLGFDKFRDYVTGAEDGVPKTPRWAEEITGVPAGRIAELAVEYATTKPAALVAGYGPCRVEHGEQFSRAAATLAAMTGNVGVAGGDAGIQIFGYPIMTKVMQFPGGYCPDNVSVHFNNWADAIIKGRAGGYPSDIKMVYSVAGNTANQLGNVRKADRALKTLDFMVVHEQFMTATARYADYILPVTTQFERNDVFTPWLLGHYIVSSNQAIKPYGECRNDIDICAQLANHLGIEKYNETSEQEWLEYLTGNAGISDRDKFKERGFLKYELERSHVAFRDQIEDIENNPFATPSGKIEIFSQSIADLQKPDVPPIPKYIPPKPATEASEFDLCLVTGHGKKSSNSMFYNLPWLRDVEAQAVWINSGDAEKRGISNGDMVKVTSAVGATTLPALVTERIVPGTVNIDQGIEFEMDSDGVDVKGCSNAVCPDGHTSTAITPYNSTRVCIKKP